MEFLPSICPGCSINCGLYIVKSDGEIKIDYRKRASVNEGKLCKFGVDLGKYYSQEPPKATVDQREVNLDTAIEEASRRLRKLNPSEVGFLYGGNSTNEEIHAFKKLAAHLGVWKLDCGLSRQILSIPEDRRTYLSASIKFRQIEEAERIILISVDPGDYPLLIRRLRRAERNGAEVISVDLDNMGDLDGAVVVAELTPKRDPGLIQGIIERAGEAFSIIFMKPYANLTGAIELGFYGTDIPHEIASGTIRSLFLLDPVWPEPIDTFSDLDLLIVQAGLKSEIDEVADITLPSPRFFERDGSVVNIEGDVLPVGGDSGAGVEILSKIVFPKNH